MTTGTQDTIFALASGQLPAGIGVVRISGPSSRFVLETMCGKEGAPRRAVFSEIRSADGELLDRGLSVWFPAPASYTGEDYCELHLHGGRAVVSSVLEALMQIDGVRAAEAGEFSMRAFVNGKMDLTAAEALADLIDAETAEQRRFALFNAGSVHDKLYERWRGEIVEILALMTAEIDFADESDVEGSLDAAKLVRLTTLADEIDSHVKQYRAGEIIREGFKVALVGAPNVGKSSLINALAGREVAIVTDIPGTTRDVLEVSLDLKGRKVVVFDTAGLRESNEPVEKIGIERAHASARNADLVIWMYDAGGGIVEDIVPDTEVPVLRVANKIDLVSDKAMVGSDIAISAATGAGIDVLTERLADVAANATGNPSVVPFRQRHVALLGETSANLRQAAAMAGDAIELRAEVMRRGADNLGRITGRVDVEDLLDVIFSRFCIGK